jgi:hypothetical protein
LDRLARLLLLVLLRTIERRIHWIHGLRASEVEIIAQPMFLRREPGMVGDGYHTEICDVPHNGLRRHRLRSFLPKTIGANGRVELYA